MKDYYKTLNLPASATLPEIKKAYRLLAQQFHPDKNAEDQYAVLHFAEIKEAYEVLSNPSRKDYYLQQRWYQQSLGKTKSNQQPVTPPAILKQFLELDQHVATLDSFRMNKQGLYEHLQQLLSDESIALLRKFKESAIQAEIIRIVLGLCRLLNESQVQLLANKLLTLTDETDPARNAITIFVQEQQRKNRWEKYRGALIILITVVISLLIYFVSR